MNYNQQGLQGGNGGAQPPYGGGMGSGNAGNPQQQQYDIEQQLAKLTPQQLQQLRQKPNLEPIVTRFLQKQQMAQQQMMQQRVSVDGGYMNNNQPPNGMNPAMAAAYQKHQQQQLLNRQMRGSNVPQNLNQQALQAQANLRNTNSTALAAAGGRSLMQARVGSAGMGMAGASGSPPASVIHGAGVTPGGATPVSSLGPNYPYPPGMGQQIPGQPIPGQQIPGAQIPGQPIPGQPIPGQPIPGQKIPGQTLGRAMGPSQPSSVGPPASKIAINQPYTKYPPVSNDVQNKLVLKNLSSSDEWSKKLKEEGKQQEISSELKIYEDVISKESKFKSSSLRQLESNKNLNEQLIKDLRTYNEIKQLRMKAIQISSQNQFNNSIWGEGYQGYGNGISNTTSQNIMPNNRKNYSKVADLKYSEKELNKIILNDLQQNPKRQLVPIRLEFEQERDKFKLRDTFLWDLNEKNITLEQFIGILLEDYKFISPSNMNTILNSIKEQIKDFHNKPEKSMGEVRIPIKINVTINNTQFIDQFEWDILNFEDNDPEEFSQILVDEMNLPGEFSTAIAHSIREQTQLFHKALFLVGYAFDGLPVSEDEIRSHLLPSLRLVSQDAKQFGSLMDDYYSILRNPTFVSDYSPTLSKLTQVEIERLDKEMERESRRKRRHNTNDDTSSLTSNSSRGTSRRGQLHISRGGPVLPDLSDIPKTFRTPQPSSVLPGGVDIGVPDIYSYNEVIVHRTQIANPDFKPPQPKVQRVFYNHDHLNHRFLVKLKYPITNDFV